MEYAEILTRIRQIVRSVNLESKQIEKEYGISIPQLLCLIFLKGKNDSRAYNKEIKGFLQLNASTVTGIISRLERKGFIIRLPKQKDKRVGMVSITNEGLKLIDNSSESPYLQLSKKLKELSPEKLQRLQSSFDTIIDFLHVEPIDTTSVITPETGIRPSENS